MEKVRKGNFKVVSTQIAAQMHALKAGEQASEKLTVKVQCRCPHRDADGIIAVKAKGKGGAHSRFTKAPLYECSVCKKLIDATPVTQEEFDKALDVMMRVIDIAKIRANIDNSEKDVEMLNDMTKLQYKMYTIMPDLFKAVSKTGGNKNKRGNANSMVSVSY